MTELKERDKWEEVNELMYEQKWLLNPLWKDKYESNPHDFPILLSRYKFAAKIITKGRKILELGSQFGMGITILAETASAYFGVDEDSELLESLAENLPGEKFTFSSHSHFTDSEQQVESLVYFSDILENKKDIFFDLVNKHLTANGQAIYGINALQGNADITYDEIRRLLEKKFKLVVPFFMNNEIVQCGQSSKCDYFLLLALQKRNTVDEA